MTTTRDEYGTYLLVSNVVQKAKEFNFTLRWKKSAGGWYLQRIEDDVCFVGKEAEGLYQFFEGYQFGKSEKQNHWRNRWPTAIEVRLHETNYGFEDGSSYWMILFEGEAEIPRIESFYTNGFDEVFYIDLGHGTKCDANSPPVKVRPVNLEGDPVPWPVVPEEEKD
jgi:hypothetical protein